MSIYFILQKRRQPRNKANHSKDVAIQYARERTDPPGVEKHFINTQIGSYILFSTHIHV